VVAPDGAVYRLDVSNHPTAFVRARQCGQCPDFSSTCGAYMPAFVQIRWKLPAGARWAGIKTARVDGPILEAPIDPPPAGCPPESAPP
jgi:hypothetical protein